jgi:hypothetical protein
MEWIARTLTLPRNVVYPALLTLMRTPRLPAVDSTDAPADLNGLAHFGERRNLVSTRVPSRFKRTIGQNSRVLHPTFRKIHSTQWHDRISNTGKLVFSKPTISNRLFRNSINPAEIMRGQIKGHL